MKNMKRVVVISDLHCGHVVGLTPPSWHYAVPAGAPRSVRRQAEFREGQWRFYAETLRALQPIDRLIVLGDCIDGDQEKGHGTELIVTKRDEQCRMAVDCIAEVRAAKVAMVYGTPYHAGKFEDWEDQVAEKFGGNIGTEQDLDINGVRFNCKHFIGNASSPVSRFTALSSEQLRQLLWAEAGQQPKADVILRGHVHRFAFAGEGRWTGFICPPLQGLGGKIARIRSGLPLAFGFLHFVVNGDGSYTWTKHLQPLSVQAARATKW